MHAYMFIEIHKLREYINLKREFPYVKEIPLIKVTIMLDKKKKNSKTVHHNKTTSEGQFMSSYLSSCYKLDLSSVVPSSSLWSGTVCNVMNCFSVSLLSARYLCCAYFNFLLHIYIQKYTEAYRSIEHKSYDMTRHANNKGDRPNCLRARLVTTDERQQYQGPLLQLCVRLAILDNYPNFPFYNFRASILKSLL